MFIHYIIVNIMDNIYNTMIINNLKKINDNGFNYDSNLICDTDKRYCYAIFSIPNKSHFNPIFYELQNLLGQEQNGITYYINNKNFVSSGTFHFTFMQQLKFDAYYDLPKEKYNKCYDILLKVLYKHLPFTIHYNRLIVVTNGLVLCGESSKDINKIRDEYRYECKINNIPLIEPYHLDIIHSTLFRFTNKEHTNFLNKYEKYFNKVIDFGYITIDHFNIGKATWKVNLNEISIDNIINI
jgi:hypothetical protein